MDDSGSGGSWTVETLRQHVLALFRERDHALDRAQRDLESYKAQSNEWRGSLADSRANLVTKEEWQTGHQNLIVKIDSEIRLVQSQLNGDSGINMRLTRIESRAGYVSITLFISVLSALLTLGSMLVSVFHSGVGK